MGTHRTKRRQVSIEEAHDRELVSISRRRGCDVVDLFREAVIAHFNLPIDANLDCDSQIPSTNDRAS
jgi:hypothetical protein